MTTERTKPTLPTSRPPLSEADLHMMPFDALVPDTEKQFFPDWTLYLKLPEWLTNFKVNYETIGFKRGIHELPKINGSAIVVDKSMASTKFYENADLLRGYKGTLIVCDRALPYLIHDNVIPTYVLNVDSSYLCQYFFDLPEVKKHMNQITAIFCVTTHPLTIRLWHGERVFFTPYLGGAQVTWNLAKISGTPIMNVGGEVSTLAWLLAYNLGANPIGMFGITNSYDSLAETEYPDTPHETETNKYGTFYYDKVYKRYAEIHKEFIKIAKRDGNVDTVNVTEGGCMYSKWIKDLSMKKFLEIYNQ